MIQPTPETTLPAERRRQQARARRLARRAETLAARGRLDEAISCQSEVAALRPRDPTAFFRLGLLYREVRHLEPAVEALRCASSLNPAQRAAREALIETLLEAGRYDEVIAESKNLVRIAPRSIFARDALSLAYLQLGRSDKALQITRELTVLDPINPAHHLKRAMLFQQDGNLKGAVEEYSRTMTMAPPDSEVYGDSADALDAIDDAQLRQIFLLAVEDRVFQAKLRRNAPEAVQERGFHLSEEGLSRARDLGDAHFPNWGGTRFYH